jgi:putative sigma-54 modulation protein
VQVKISVRHGHLSDTTQQLIREKALKLTNVFDRITLIDVTVDLKKSEMDKAAQVEFIVQTEHKHDIVAQESHPDVIAAVDLCLHKVQGQLRRYKEKIQDHRRTPSMGQTGRSTQMEEATED